MRRQAASCSQFHLTGGGCACVNQPRVCWKTRLADLRFYGSQFPFSVRRASEKTCQPVHEMAQPASDEPTASRSKCQLCHWRGARYRPPTPRLPRAPSPRGPHSAAELSQQIQISEQAIVCRAVPLHEMKTLRFAHVSLFSVISLLPCTDRDLLAVKTAGGKDSSSSQL